MKKTNKNLIIFIIVMIPITLSLFIPHVDFITKKNQKKIEKIIMNTMEEKYGKIFTIELIDKEPIRLCMDTYVSECNGEYKPLGASLYTFKVTDPNNASAYVIYYDQYYDIFWSKSEEKLIEEYQYTHYAYERYEEYLPKIRNYIGEDIITKIEFKNSDIEDTYSPVYSINIHLSSQTIDEELIKKLSSFKSNKDRYQIGNTVRFKSSLPYLKINIILESDPNKEYELNEILKKNK